MTYFLEIAEELNKRFAKLAKRDKILFEALTSAGCTLAAHLFSYSQLKKSAIQSNCLNLSITTTHTNNIVKL